VTRSSYPVRPARPDRASSRSPEIKGYRTIGIAGGPAKCRWVVEKLGAEAAIDYKAENVATRLAELCPEGIGVYFDNVGGRSSRRRSAT